MFPPFTPRPYTPPAPPAPPVVLPRPTMAAWGNIEIPSDTTVIAADARLVAVLSLYPASPPRPELNQWLSGDAVILRADAVLLSGGVLNIVISNAILEASAQLIASYVSGTTIPATWTLLVAAPELRMGSVLTQPGGGGGGDTAGINWLKWSQIGALNFTIDRSNIAGQMPLPLRGALWAILRHGRDIMLYGRNGVYKLIPAGNAYGYQPMLDIGLRSKRAVADCGPIVGGLHYFVDAHSRLWKVADGLELLDYREWLSGLSTIVLSFDPITRLLYLCDGTTGYVYNVETGSFGKGPATITAIGAQGGSLYVCASGAITVPNFAFSTDITDFKTRKGKTVHSFEVGVDTTLTLEGAIDYRLQKQASFLSTNWYPIDSRGQCYVNAYGYEFRFKVRATTGGWFHLDSVRVYGDVHAH